MVEKYKMLLVYVFVTCLVVASAASTVGARGKTYPGVTYWSNNKTGEVIKLIGPMYFKIKKFEMTQPPYDLKSNFSLHIELTPTIEVISLFVDGVLSFNGLIFQKSDPASDLCMVIDMRNSTMQCPLHPGQNYIFKENISSFSINRIGFPLFSGRYVYKATFTMADQISGEDITLFRCEINIVI